MTMLACGYWDNC